MKFGSFKLAAWCLVAAMLPAIPLARPASALADPPGGGGSGSGRHYDRDRGGPGGGGPGPGLPQWNSEQWQEFRAQLNVFCKEHCPRRWAEIQDQVDRARAAGHGWGAWRSIAGMSMQFRGLQALEKQDPALYKIKVRQIEVEDAEYGLITDLKNLDPADTARADELKAQLAKSAREYVDLRLQERGCRIEHLARMIQSEKESLAKDTQNRDGLADDRVARIIEEGPDFFLNRPGPGGGPGHGRHPEGGGAGGPPSTAPHASPSTVNATPAK